MDLVKKNLVVLYLPAEETLPGNAVTNPTKPPVEKQAIGDGVAGPAGEGFGTDLERMLTELEQHGSDSWVWSWWIHLSCNW